MWHLPGVGIVVQLGKLPLETPACYIRVVVQVLAVPLTIYLLLMYLEMHQRILQVLESLPLTWKTQKSFWILASAWPSSALCRQTMEWKNLCLLFFFSLLLTSSIPVSLLVPPFCLSNEQIKQNRTEQNMISSKEASIFEQAGSVRTPRVYNEETLFCIGLWEASLGGQVSRLEAAVPNSCQ